MSSLKKHLPLLWEWYQGVARPFPWRSPRPDPYAVWISEVMSHQSTMATVVPYFTRWMKSFPSLELLAQSSEESVLGAWAGLGYYSRARNVHKAAKLLQSYRDQNAGRWPKSYEEWWALPGIGPYSAAAITAICFEGEVLPLDGNVIRVLARFFGIPNPLNKASDRAAIETHLKELSSQVLAGRHGLTAQATMELGATVCRPGAQALCDLCPLEKGCASRKTGDVAFIPRAKERKKTQKIKVLALVYRNPQQKILLRQVPTDSKRLAGQWELPLWEQKPALEQLDETQLQKAFEVSSRPVKHAITHHLYEVRKVEAGLWEGPVPSRHVFWAQDQLPPGTLTTLTKKILLI